MWSEDDASKDVVAHASNNESKEPEIVDAPRIGRERINGRERSLSVPCRSETASVDTVMTKAKRASSYLWMLLHSQPW